MKLKYTEDNKIIADHLEVAESFLKRSIGLLGRNYLESNYALWIKPCNSIHTFFMKFPIDAIFVDKDLNIQKIYHSLKSGRITLPNYNYHSVFEMKAGSAKLLKITEGGKFYVCT